MFNKMAIRFSAQVPSESRDRERLAQSGCHFLRLSLCGYTEIELVFVCLSCIELASIL